MAIVKVGTYRNPPEDITDYEAIVSHLEAYTRQVGNQGMILTEWTNTTNAPKIAMGSYISHGGVLYVVDTEDYVLPALSSDGTYYLRVSASGDTLAITYTTNIADYSWNAVYGGLYHADESQVLPYQVVKNSALIEKYKMLNPWQNDDFSVVNYLGRYRELHVTGAISGASLAVTGNATVGGTLGVTGALGFASLNPDNSTETSIELSVGESQVLPKGAYAIMTGNTYVKCQMKYGSDWVDIFGGGGFVISDGVNFRLKNDSSSGSRTSNIRKW